MNAPTYKGGTLQFEPSYSYKQYTFTIVLGGDDDGEDDGDVDDDAPGYHPSRILIHKSKKMQSISYCIQKCCRPRMVMKSLQSIKIYPVKIMFYNIKLNTKKVNTFLSLHTKKEIFRQCIEGLFIAYVVFPIAFIFILIFAFFVSPFKLNSYR